MSEEAKKTGLIEIEATKKIGDEEKSVVVTYDFGETLADAVAKFGEEVVFSNFIRNAKITAQGIMRRGLETGKSEEEIATIINGWKPGVTLERSFDPLAALTNKMKNMSEDEIAAIFDKLKAAAGK